MCVCVCRISALQLDDSMNVSALLSRGPYLVRLRGALDSAVRGRIGGSESVRGAGATAAPSGVLPLPPLPLPQGACVLAVFSH